MRLAAAILVFVALSGFAVSSGFSQRKGHKSGGGGTRYQAFMEVTGQSQGKFKGAGRSKSNRIPVISATFGMGSSVDKRTGQPSGKKTNSFAVVVIEAVDIKDFQRAVAKHEVLTEVEIETVKSTPDGRMMVNRVIKLTNATVTHVQVNLGQSKGGGQLTERVTIAYQKIQFMKPTAKTMAVDDWKS